MPAAPAPGPASAMGPAPGMTPPGMMPGGGLPAHFAQAQQPPQFSYPTGAHPQPGFADASAQPKPQQPGAPVGLIIGAVALLIVALGGFALFILFGRSSGASTGTASSASASAQPVASPVPAPSPTPPPIATPTETQAANEPPPPDSASAAPSNEPPPTPTTTTTTPTPTPTATTTTVATGGNTWTPPTATAVPKPTPTAAPEPVDPRAWNESAARARLSQANGAMAFCRQADNPGGAGSATVTFAPEGNVASVALDPPYAGTKTGDCVAGQFKRAKLNPFDGPSRTLKHSFEVPK